MNRSEIKAVLQQLSEEYYKNSLEQAGFVSYRNEGLNWYKIKNDVLFCVLLTAISGPGINVFWLAYGVHPLFIKTYFAPGYLYRNILAPQECYKFYYFSKDNYQVLHYNPSGISYPNLPRRGAEDMENVIFPLFSQISSGWDAYCYHKSLLEFYISQRKNGSSFHYYPSEQFVNEAIYYQDKVVYPWCQNTIENYKDNPNATLEEKTWATIHQNAMSNNDFSQFILMLQTQKDNLIKQIKRKMPRLQIPIEALSPVNQSPIRESIKDTVCK